MPLNIPREKVPQVYVKECVIGGLSQNKLAIRLGITGARLSQILGEMAPLVEAEKAKLSITPPTVDIKTEMSRLWHEANAIFLTSMETGSTEDINRGWRMMMQVIDRMDWKDKLPGASTNIFIKNATIQQFEAWGKPHLQMVTKIVLKYVPTALQSECCMHLDRYISGVVGDAMSPPLPEPFMKRVNAEVIS